MAGVFAVPRVAGAFWPFFTKASGAAIGEPILHDTKLALLTPANNSDPNPYKGAQDIEMTEGAALIAHTGPEGALPESGNIQNGGRISLYVVREGDTLSDIAHMFDVSPNTIKWANGIRDVSLIKPGVELIVLPIDGVKHTVARGDTLSSLAKKYNSDAVEIALYNGLAEGAALVSGTELVIPGGEIAAPKASGSLGRVPSSSVVVSSDPHFVNPVPGSRLTQGIHGYNGVDFGAPAGTPVYAAAAGTVIVAQGDGGWHGGVQTLYGHLSFVSVAGGQSVSQGARIGSVGRTGRATGNHLHFEVRGTGKPNPFSR